MKVIVAIGDKNGMLFNKRRQSQDEKLREYILKLCKSNKLHMNSYSAKQFKNNSEILVSENFLEKTKDSFCFVETNPLAPYVDEIETLYICKWNREYPSDMKLDIDLTDGWVLNFFVDIEGNSHKKITIEEWSKLWNTY